MVTEKEICRESSEKSGNNSFKVREIKNIII